MSKLIREFNGKAGNVYIQKAAEGNDRPYEVWFEDFCILGDGDSETEALQAAALHVADISLLIAVAMNGIDRSPYKGPIAQPCSACSAGDTAMEHHDHDYVSVEKRR